MTVPPHCRTLWATSAPPSDPLQRVRALHVKLGEVAFEANQAFVDDGGVAAVVQIAFGAWPDGGVAASTHWADEVVQIAPGVHHSARRLALSALADMAPEGEPDVSALVSNVLFREAFAPAAVTTGGSPSPRCAARAITTRASIWPSASSTSPRSTASH